MNQAYQAPGSPARDTDPYQPAVFQSAGRLGRMRYFVYLTAIAMVVYGFLGLVMIIANIGMATAHPGMVILAGGVCGSIASLIVLVMSVLLGVRRLNDMNASGWLMLLLLIPFANLILGLVLLCVPGSRGANKYGPPAAANSPGLRAAMFILILMLLAWAGLFGGVYITTFQTTLHGGSTLHSLQDTAQGQRL